jgi:uncharacterized cupin superfamily protein
MLGMAIRVVNPGEPSTTYHWETEQEDFLVLSGEAVLIVEGQERPLKQWDFVHCRIARLAGLRSGGTVGGFSPPPPALRARRGL